jgi:hypothetical protein
MWANKLLVDEIPKAENDLAILNQDHRCNRKELAHLLIDAPNIQFAIARTIGLLFGFNLYFVSGFTDAQGETTNCGTAAYLYETDDPSDMKRILWTAGHEMWHLLELSNTEFYKQFKSKLKNYLSREDIESKHKLLNPDIEQDSFELLRKREDIPCIAPSLNERTDIQVEFELSECIADYNGQMWIEKEFWNLLIERDEDKVHKVVYKQYSEWLTQNNIAPKNRTIIHTNYRDTIREIMVDAWISRLIR